MESYYEKVKALMHIRHENIVSFMGAASNLLLPFDEQLKSYLIVTNPVRAESLYAKSDQLDQIQLAKKMSIAYQVIFLKRDPRCWKITEKVSFNIASEASYVYDWSSQKFIKNAKNSRFGEFFEKNSISNETFLGKFQTIWRP